MSLFLIIVIIKPDTKNHYYFKDTPFDILEFTIDYKINWAFHLSLLELDFRNKSLNTRNNDGYNIIDLFYSHGNYDLNMLLPLLNKGVNPSNINNIGTPKYFKLFNRNYIESKKMLNYLILNSKINLNHKDPYSKNTPLTLASQTSFDIVKLIIKHGANPNYYSFSKGYDPIVSPLKSAFTFSKVEIIKYYIMELKVDFKKQLGKKDILTRLRFLDLPLTSKAHQTKMEIVNYLLEEHHLNYWNTPIPEGIKRKNRKRGDNYLLKY